MVNIQDFDYLLINRNNTDYKISLSDVKEFYDRTSTITISEPSPQNSSFFESNECEVIWKNKTDPPGPTYVKTYGYIKGDTTTKYYLVTDENNTVVATTTKEENYQPTTSEGTTTIKWDDYPITQLVHPDVIGEFKNIAHSIKPFTFSDGELIYIATGGRNDNSSIYCWTNDPLRWENVSIMPAGQKGWGFHVEMKNDILYVAPGDGRQFTLKSEDRGKTWVEAGQNTSNQKRGFYYSPTYDKFFTDTNNGFDWSDDDCQTWNAGTYQGGTPSGERGFKDNAHGLWAVGGRKIFLWDDSTNTFNLIANNSNIASDVTNWDIDGDGTIIFVQTFTDIDTHYTKIEADGTWSTHPGPTPGQQYRAIAWVPARADLQGRWVIVGDGKVSESFDGITWETPENISNRALDACNDPASGTILIAGSGSPFTYQLVVKFDPNVLFSGGTLQSELYSGSKLIAESNVIDIPILKFDINTPVEWEFNSSNVPVVTKDATTINGVAPISMIESIEYTIDPTPLTHVIPKTALEMNYFAPQNIFVCPYGQRDTYEGPDQGIDHFSIDTNTFSTTYSHPGSGSCRHGSFLAKSNDHEYVGVLFSKHFRNMEDGSMVVMNENGVEKVYPESELPARESSETSQHLPTKFFFKTVGNDEYLYISWYSRDSADGELSYISRTKNPVQFDSEGFPIFPVDINEYESKIQVFLASLDYSLRGAILGGVYQKNEETLYVMARDAILAYKIDDSGEIEDAIEYPTRGAGNTSARLVVTKDYIIKTIILTDGSTHSSVSINKSTGVETDLNDDFVHVATADRSRIFRLRQNEVIQYMDYDETGNPADESTWHEYQPTNGQTLPDENLGGYGVVKENPFSLVWDGPGNQLNVWGSKPLSGSEACVIQTFTDSMGDTCESKVCDTVP